MEKVGTSFLPALLPGCLVASSEEGSVDGEEHEFPMALSGEPTGGRGRKRREHEEERR